MRDSFEECLGALVRRGKLLPEDANSLRKFREKQGVQERFSRMKRQLKQISELYALPPWIRNRIITILEEAKTEEVSTRQYGSNTGTVNEEVRG